jgi:hypothetical protein
MKNSASALSPLSLFSFLFASKAPDAAAPKAGEFMINDHTRITVRNGFEIKPITLFSENTAVFQSRKKCACTEMLYNFAENIFYVAEQEDADAASHDATYLKKMDLFIDKIKEVHEEQNLNGAFAFILMSPFAAMAELGDNPELTYGVYLPKDGTQTAWQKLSESHFNLRKVAAELKLSHA